MASSADTLIQTVSLDSGDPQEKVGRESVLAEIDKLELPPELEPINNKELKQIYDNAKSVSVLVTGTTGSGKSTLINGILGLDVKGKRKAKEGHNLKPCTTKVEAYRVKKGKIVATVWDSPGGTENEEEYLQQMKEQCSERNLTIYCIKITDTRLVRGSDKVRAMKKLTETFGHDFWKTTIIVLTFANSYQLINKDWKDLDDQEKPLVYERKIQQWSERIRESLTNDINVPDEIVRAIRIVPAGYYREPHLPGYKFWLSNLWFHCISTISTPEGQAALVKMNADRFKQEEDTTEEDFAKSIEEQPLVDRNVDETAAAVRFWWSSSRRTFRFNWFCCWSTSNCCRCHGRGSNRL